MINRIFFMKGGRKITLRKVLALAVACSIAGSLISCAKQKDNDIRLTWAVPGERVEEFDEIEAEINGITTEKLGITVNFEFLNSGDYQNRINSKIEAGENIDLCFTGYLDSYRARVSNDQLMPLNELLKCTPELKETIPEYLWHGAEVDGKIYAVPHQQISSVAVAMMVSKPLADKYGFDVSSVKSTEDIEPFLQILHENEPEVYPARVNWGIDAVTSINSNEFNEMNYGGVYVKNIGGEIKVKLITEDESKRYAADKIHEWYTRGYIRPDIAIAGDSISELAQGKYGIWFENYKPGVEYQRKLMTGNDVYAVQISRPYISASSIQSAMTGISSVSKHPVEAIKLLELVNTEPEILNLLTYGIENKHYKKVSDNVIERTDNIFSYQTWLFGSQFIISTDINQDEDIWEKTKEINLKAEQSPLIGFVFDTSSLTGVLTKCNEVLGKYPTISNGIEDPAEYWEAYDRELREAGAEKIKNEIEKQINEFLAGKN